MKFAKENIDFGPFWYTNPHASPPPPSFQYVLARTGQGKSRSGTERGGFGFSGHESQPPGYGLVRKRCEGHALQSLASDPAPAPGMPVIAVLTRELQLNCTTAPGDQTPPPPPPAICQILVGGWGAFGMSPGGYQRSGPGGGGRLLPWCVTGLYKGSRTRIKHMVPHAKKFGTAGSMALHHYLSKLGGAGAGGVAYKDRPGRPCSAACHTELTTLRHPSAARTALLTLLFGGSPRCVPMRTHALRRVGIGGAGVRRGLCRAPCVAARGRRRQPS